MVRLWARSSSTSVASAHANQAETSVLSRFSVSGMRPYDIALWTLALA